MWLAEEGQVPVSTLLLSLQPSCPRRSQSPGHSVATRTGPQPTRHGETEDKGLRAPRPHSRAPRGLQPRHQLPRRLRGGSQGAVQKSCRTENPRQASPGPRGDRACSRLLGVSRPATSCFPLMSPWRGSTPLWTRVHTLARLHRGAWPSGAWVCGGQAGDLAAGERGQVERPQAGQRAPDGGGQGLPGPRGPVCAPPGLSAPGGRPRLDREQAPGESERCLSRGIPLTPGTPRLRELLPGASHPRRWAPGSACVLRTSEDDTRPGLRLRVAGQGSGSQAQWPERHHSTCTALTRQVLSATPRRLSRPP